jgi:O-antigen/teichoic acid export membrane protein
VLNSVVSLLVIRLTSPALWGEVVQALILVQLGAHVVAWGSKEYLLRAFSLNPAGLAREWQSSLMTRSLLVVPWCLLVLALPWPGERALLVVAWGLAAMLVQAFDPLVAYRRDFVYAGIVEAGVVLAAVAAILAIGPALELHAGIAILAGATLLRALFLVARYRRDVLGGRGPGAGWSGSLDRGYFVRAQSFFLLGFSGMLQSRVDLYCVSLLLPREEVAQYQVFSNLLTYVQALSAFTLAPFLRALYRLPLDAVPRIAARLLAFGLVLLGPALVSAHLVLAHLYGFHFPFAYFVTGALFVLPIYFYLPFIYALYRVDQQTTVLRINLLGVLAGGILALALVPSLGMLGGVAASAAAQWLMLVAYLAQARRPGRRSA